MSISKNKLLGINIPSDLKKTILEKVASWIGEKGEMRHIVSLNPENLVTAYHDDEFRLILQSADVKLVDGVGVTLASKLRGNSIGERYTGVDFTVDILARLSNGSSRVLFLGGEPYLAAELAKCYKEKFPSMQFVGINGIKDIKRYQKAIEGEQVLSKIRDYKPHIIFAAFGSPFQEKWFWQNRIELKNTVCVGVGGAFDFISENVQRAPAWMRAFGLEWLFRLLHQPWRWRRQLKLFEFMYLVLKGE